MSDPPEEWYEATPTPTSYQVYFDSNGFLDQIECHVVRRGSVLPDKKPETLQQVSFPWDLWEMRVTETRSMFKAGDRLLCFLIGTVHASGAIAHVVIDNVLVAASAAHTLPTTAPSMYYNEEWEKALAPKRTEFIDVTLPQNPGFKQWTLQSSPIVRARKQRRAPDTGPDAMAIVSVMANMHPVKIFGQFSHGKHVRVTCISGKRSTKVTCAIVRQGQVYDTGDILEAGKRMSVFPSDFWAVEVTESEHDAIPVGIQLNVACLREYVPELKRRCVRFVNHITCEHETAKRLNAFKRINYTGTLSSSHNRTHGACIFSDTLMKQMCKSIEKARSTKAMRGLAPAAIQEYRNNEKTTAHAKKRQPQALPLLATNISDRNAIAMFQKHLLTCPLYSPETVDFEGMAPQPDFIEKVRKHHEKLTMTDFRGNFGTNGAIAFSHFV
jgi:hypothetical protein